MVKWREKILSNLKIFTCNNRRRFSAVADLLSLNDKNRLNVVGLLTRARVKRSFS